MVKDIIPSITGLDAIAALNTVEKKIVLRIISCNKNVSDLVKITDYNAEISNIETNVSARLIIINLQGKYLMKR